MKETKASPCDQPSDARPRADGVSLDAGPRRAVFWGTYDLGKPRTRILLKSLRQAGVNVDECHADVWGGVEDKSQVKGMAAKLKRGLSWLISYPGLVWRYLRLPKHDAVIVGYLGHLDVLVLWPFARIRGVPIVWDAFLSLYNTVVEDRRMVRQRGLLARLLWFWEWLACRAADQVILDTKAHGRYFIERYRLDPAKVHRVFVGVEPDAFPAVPGESGATGADELLVLFYGQFIPLHGIETIVEAARLMSDQPVRWMLIGSGQQEGQIRRMLKDQPLPRVEWLPWVRYEALVNWIHKADVCLGVFGATAKTAMVIPNKVYQILAAEKPLITADTPAIHELFDADGACVLLVPPDQPDALCEAVSAFRDRQSSPGGICDRRRLQAIKARFSLETIGDQLAVVLRRASSDAVTRP